MRYCIAEPNAYLAITGAGINSVQIKKKAVHFWPFQKVAKFSITPFDFSIELKAMTIEKLQFALPAVCTIGPEDDIESLQKYAKLLTGKQEDQSSKKAIAVGEGRSHVQDIVQGIIEGETRAIVSTMTMEELFKERQMFRDKVINNVQSELNQFGLKIYNANVKELQDCAGSEYFTYLSMKAHEGASNQAKVDVAEARMNGQIGEAERKGKAKQEIAKIDAATAVLETQRKAEKALADAKLADAEIGIEKDLKLSRIAAQWAAEERDAELQKGVQQKRADMELERQRAGTVTKAVIERESQQQRANAEKYTVEKCAAASLFRAEKTAAGVKAQRVAEADAEAYALLKTAEAHKMAKQMEADAEAYSKKQESDAFFYRQQREAHGMLEMAKGFSSLSNSLGGASGLMQYLMLKENTYEKLAQANAKAIHGLQPKINVWNTGSQTDSVDSMAPIRNLFQTIPPLMEAINSQTGMKPPSWLMRMPDDQRASPGTEVAKPGVKDLNSAKLINGNNH